MYTESDLVRHTTAVRLAANAQMRAVIIANYAALDAAGMASDAQRYVDRVYLAIYATRKAVRVAYAAAAAAARASDDATVVASFASYRATRVQLAELLGNMHSTVQRVESMEKRISNIDDSPPVTHSSLNNHLTRGRHSFRDCGTVGDRGSSLERSLERSLEEDTSSVVSERCGEEGTYRVVSERCNSPEEGTYSVVRERCGQCRRRRARPRVPKKKCWWEAALNCIRSKRIHLGTDSAEDSDDARSLQLEQE